MSFDSLAYLVFLPTIYVLYRLLGRTGQNRMLLVASYVFYGWWDPRFLFLITLSTSIDYCAGLMIDRGVVHKRAWIWSIAWPVMIAAAVLLPDFERLQRVYLGQSAARTDLIGLIDPLGLWVIAVLAVAAACSQLLYARFADMEEQARRRTFLLLSVCANLSIIGFFKYFDFFVDSAEDIARSLGLGPVEILHLDLVLPVGISFYTFQTMSYSFDVYRRKVAATDDFLSFALFVSYFPQLVAGPIERASHLLPALLKDRRITIQQTTRGLFLILMGLFKKVAIANGVAESVDSVYNTAGQVSGLDVVAATFLFAVQIYADFSGYSDIARGTSKLLGIDLMFNFNVPYFSRNPSEFWRRWHISLSTWLRDYLYIPLGGNRGSNVKTYRNLTITMLLGGLWHGAAWNFVLWGAYHGAILCAHRLWQERRSGDSREAADAGLAARLLQMGGFFIVTCYGWLLFRAGSFAQIAEFSSLILTDMSNPTVSMKIPPFSTLLGLPLLAGFDSIAYATGETRFYRRYPPFVRGAIYAMILFATILGMSNVSTQFIYFQF